MPTLFMAIAQIEACPAIALLGGAAKPCSVAKAEVSTGAISTVTVAPIEALTVMPKMISASVRGSARNALPAPRTATHRHAPVR